MTALDELARQRVFPVLRCADPEDAVATARAAAAGGMRLVELTMSTPNVLEAAAPLLEEGLTVAVGTISSAAQAEAAIAAGATLLVSYFNPPGFLAAAAAAGVPAIPGAFTPSEIAAAHLSGAAAVKLFPAMLATPGYLDGLRPLLPSVRLVVAGGVVATGDAVRPWLEAGALAVGLGAALGTAGTVGPAEVERRSRALLADL